LSFKESFWNKNVLYKNKNINRINKDGFLIVKSEKTRKNLLNQADCMDQIRSMIFDAAQVKKEISSDDLIQIEIK